MHSITLCTQTTAKHFLTEQTSQYVEPMQFQSNNLTFNSMFADSNAIGPVASDAEASWSNKEYFLTH